MLAEHGGMLSVDLGWTDPPHVWMCVVTPVGIVVREVSIESGRIEVMDNMATNTWVVVVGHRRNIGGRAVADEGIV